MQTLLDDPAQPGPHRIPLVVESIKKEQWFANLVYWHDPSHDTPPNLVAHHADVERSEPAPIPYEGFLRFATPPATG